MRIHIASDHAAYDFKQALAEHLKNTGYEVVDHGAHSYDPQDDYPAYCIACAEATVADPGSLGIVAGGSGNGEQMAANLVHGARAALAWNDDTARLAREHNDANVLSIGARMHELTEALAIVDVFLRTEFSRDPRHQRRIGQMADYSERVRKTQ